MNNLFSKKNLLSLVILLSFGFLMIGCSGQTTSVNSNNTSTKESNNQNSDKDDKTGSLVDSIKSKGKLVLGTSADYPPYEFHKISNGKDEIVGFDISLAEEIAKDLGVELVIKEMNFKGLIPALKSNKVDILISGMTPTPDRAQEVDFSDIYYKAVQSIVVHKNDIDSFKSLDDLKGKKVGVQKSSIQETLVREKIEDANITSLGKATDLILSLNSNKVDYIVLENPVAEAFVNQNSDLVVVDFELPSDEDGSAAAVNKNNPELIESINKTIEKLKSENKIDEFVLDAIKLSEEE